MFPALPTGRPLLPAPAPRLCCLVFGLLAAFARAGVRADEPGANRPVRNEAAKNEAAKNATDTKPQAANSQPAALSAKTRLPAPKTYSGADILATVEGEPITRAEFTAFWLKVDTQASRPIGMILLNQMRDKNGLASAYTVRDTDIYRALYAGPPESWTTFLSNLVTNRLVAREAARRHVIVTQREAEDAGRDLLRQAREQQGLNLSDADILDKFHVPRDLFFQEMMFRLRGERLYADSLARRNGHPLTADDWIILRELFAGANLGTDAAKNAREMADAKMRVEKWAGEVKAGKPFAEVAAAHNEDETRTQGGLRGPALRGTGTPEVEEAVFRLRSGQMSAPLRTKDGWYVFLAERRGAQIPPAERDAAWRMALDRRRTPFLAELRRHARITSAVPLPDDTLTTPAKPAAPTAAP